MACHNLNQLRQESSSMRSQFCWKHASLSVAVPDVLLQPVHAGHPEGSWTAAILIVFMLQRP